MDQDRAGQEPISLARGGTLRIPEGEGTLVYVWEGEVWLTEDGRQEDHVLAAGQWFRLGRSAAIAQAFRHSVLTLTRPVRPPSYLRRAFDLLFPLRWA